MATFSKFSLIPITLFYLISFLTFNYASAKKTPPVPFVLENNNLGKKFWLALPQNAREQDALAEVGLEIIVVPIKKADIQIEVTEFGFLKTVKDAEPFKPVVFSSRNGGAQYTWVVKESEKVQNLGVM